MEIIDKNDVIDYAFFDGCTVVDFKDGKLINRKLTKEELKRIPKRPSFTQEEYDEWIEECIKEMMKRDPSLIRYS